VSQRRKRRGGESHHHQEGDMRKMRRSHVLPYHMGPNNIVVRSCKSRPLFLDFFVKEIFPNPIKIHVRPVLHSWWKTPLNRTWYLVGHVSISGLASIFFTFFHSCALLIDIVGSCPG
jgi:hypothetical protein